MYGKTAYVYTPRGEPIKPEEIQLLPLGAKVQVLHMRRIRPYRVVRWGKHSRKRLQWMPWADQEVGESDSYLSIRVYKYRRFFRWV